jgi:hypothetical protein
VARHGLARVIAHVANAERHALFYVGKGATLTGRDFGADRNSRV